MRRLLLAFLLLPGSCKKEPPPPPPEPPKCARVERGGDEIVEEVICSGRDADADGIDDAVDLCPELSEIENGLEEKDGCPDPDPDRDGLPDEEDACPQQAGPPPDGCPLEDRDRDGIADHLDACPSQAEDVDGERDHDGCPDGAEAEVVTRTRKDQLWQAARIEVRRGRAQPTREGEQTLEALLEAVRPRAKEIVRVRLIGYAALSEVRRGRAKRLAAERVERVRRALREAGIDDERIEAALFPLRKSAERAGHIDVMVFLPLEAVLRPKDPRPEDWDAEVLPEPYPEPEEAPTDEDWDL